MTSAMLPISAMTAEDLMARDVVRLPQDMPLRDAALLLLRNQVGGAPVVDAEGRCIGVLTSIDVLRLAHSRRDWQDPAAPAPSSACDAQAARSDAEGRGAVVCTLPQGSCPIQRSQLDTDGLEILLCSQPNCVLTDWQIVEFEKLPGDEVARFMSANPVTAARTTPLPKLARMMVDAHIHRIIVIDSESRPIGVVSSTDVLGAVADEFDA